MSGAFNDGIVLCYASVSGTQKTKKDTQALKWLLEKKNYDFTQIDVARDEVTRGIMRKKSNGQKALPQLFVNGKYIGVRYFPQFSGKKMHENINFPQQLVCKTDV